MRRFVALTVPCAIFAIGACTATTRSPVPMSHLALPRVSENRAGIAIVASGGVTGWEHITVLDSATARYVTVTRRVCSTYCTPIDSAMGTLTPADVAEIYAIADSERAFFERHKGGACTGCADRALVTTAVFGNRRRLVVRSAPETSPEVLGRVHVALAEAIRASRMPAVDEATIGPPND